MYARDHAPASAAILTLAAVAALPRPRRALWRAALGRVRGADALREAAVAEARAAGEVAAAVQAEAGAAAARADAA